jgi:hypothetical protein
MFLEGFEGPAVVWVGCEDLLLCVETFAQGSLSWGESVVPRTFYRHPGRRA